MLTSVYSLASSKQISEKCDIFYELYDAFVPKHPIAIDFLKKILQYKKQIDASVRRMAVNYIYLSFKQEYVSIKWRGLLIALYRKISHLRITDTCLSKYTSYLNVSIHLYYKV